MLSLSNMKSLQPCAVLESQGILVKVCCPWVTLYP